MDWTIVFCAALLMGAAGVLLGGVIAFFVKLIRQGRRRAPIQNILPYYLYYFNTI